MIAIHPYVRYAQALIMVEHDLQSCVEIMPKHIIAEIEKGLDSFRMHPIESVEGKTRVKYDFIKTEKGNPKQGLYLAPNIISKDKISRYIWNESHKLINILENEPIAKMDDVSTSIAPISGEYLTFSLQGKIGRGNPRITLKEKGFSTVTTLTSIKPCLQFRIDKKTMPIMYNLCIIPDLPIEKLKSFIQIFKGMRQMGTDGDLMFGNVLSKKTGKGKNEKMTYEPKRPLIYKGNFPNPPNSSLLGSIALLGAIGEFSKHSLYSEQAKSVLDSLKETTLYLVKYGSAATFTYNHYVIDLAKEGKLKTIIDSLYYSKIYNQDRRSSSNNEYQKFDLFTGRFLQLFNHAAFKDFLSFRAEYPNGVSILFNIYFKRMEKIDYAVISSARTMGNWLNKVAYFTAKDEVKAGIPNYWEELRKVKSKALIEIESSIFSAKSGDALIAQAVTRAGRLSGLDAPETAALFMEKTASGELLLEKAKNLLIAFSRIKNKSEKKDLPNEDSDDDLENDDFSDE